MLCNVVQCCAMLCNVVQCCARYTSCQYMHHTNCIVYVYLQVIVILEQNYPDRCGQILVINGMSASISELIVHVYVIF